ncbi:putative reductive dehalogenase (rdhA), partial [marine sediment metagenome]
ETVSNNPGVKKYYINPEKCFEFWAENTSDCSKCITVCPFFNIENSFSADKFWKE